MRAGERVVLGLSGGVDSAVAARLLIDSGYEVRGLYLDNGLPFGGEDAKKTAKALGIPLEIRDIREELDTRVCAPFAAAYLRGETPNPCVDCNPTVKLPALIRLADKIGAKYIATGHYARAEGARLYRGAPENDQSYMLCRLTPEQAGRLLLPLGAFAKAEVREMARLFALPVASKPDSMEICFIPDGDYAAYIEARAPAPGEGNFVDGHGKILGRHRGIHRYTVGQRRGLGISAPNRLFVSEIRPASNEVVLSDQSPAGADFPLSVRDISWLVKPEADEFTCRVRLRHSKGDTPARVKIQGSGAVISLLEGPHCAPTPGQSAVMYDGELLLGGGYIEKRGETEISP